MIFPEVGADHIVTYISFEELFEFLNWARQPELYHYGGFMSLFRWLSGQWSTVTGLPSYFSLIYLSLYKCQLAYVFEQCLKGKMPVMEMLESQNTSMNPCTIFTQGFFFFNTTGQKPCFVQFTGILRPILGMCWIQLTTDK